MRKLLVVALASILLLGGCSTTDVNKERTFNGTTILLSNEQILVNGETITSNSEEAVYVGEPIIYYEDGHDETYGEGEEKDAHSAEEALSHTVITITQPGNYQISGKLSLGQIAIDLGEDAKEDSNAVVNLTLYNTEITSTVAPAIVVYNAYECSSSETDNATMDVDTSNAGFNLILADDSVNTINGSYVAKIYKEGTTKKLHKYDAAIDSKISYTIDGEEKDNGVLVVNAENEGISSNLHLTINGGNITINSSDDAINTNEDGVSVLTINSGILTCDSGLGSEGDGIDSNGWIVINGGYVVTSANGQSQDSGLDADNGIYLNGGIVLGSGNMYDEVSSESTQNFVVFGFNSTLNEESILLIKDAEDKPVVAFSAANAYSMLVYSSNSLVEGEYTLYKVDSVEGNKNGGIYTNITNYTNAIQLAHSSQVMGMGGRPMGGGQMPENFDPSQMHENLPESFNPGQQPGEFPEDFDPTKQGEMPVRQEGFKPNNTNGEAPQMPQSGMNQDNMPNMPIGEQQPIFTIKTGSNMFNGISEFSQKEGK